MTTTRVTRTVTKKSSSKSSVRAKPKKATKTTKTKSSKDASKGSSPMPGQLQMTLCTYNVKQIRTALKKYYADHNVYPKSLIELYPQYIPCIPRCPAIQKDTYSSSYGVTEDRKKFIFCCGGENHRNLEIPPNFPTCTADLGVEIRPGVFDSAEQTSADAILGDITSSNDFESLYRKGMAAYGNRDYKAAKELLERAVQSGELPYSDNKQAKCTLQEIIDRKLAESDRFTEIEDTGSVSGTPMELYNKGIACYNNMNYEKAKIFLSQALKSGKLDYSEEKQAKKILNFISEKGI